jgi:hypothetical protein
VRFDDHELLLSSCDALGRVVLTDLRTFEVLHTIQGSDSMVGPVTVITSAAAENASCATTSLLEFSSERYLLTHSRTDLLVYRAGTGEIYARQTVALSQDDAILAIDCSRFPAEDRVRVAAITTEGGLAVWVVHLPGGGSVHTVRELRSVLAFDDAATEASETSAPVAYQGVTFSHMGRFLVAWAAAEVAVWMQNEHPLVPVSSAVGSVSTNADASIMETLATEAAYSPVATRRLVNDAYMTGPVLAGVIEDGCGLTLRVVLATGWVVDHPLILDEAHDSVQGRGSRPGSIASSTAAAAD